MKKIHLLYILPIVVATLFTASCKKKNPTPQPIEEEAADPCESMMCLPANVSKFFIPEGVWGESWWDNGADTVQLAFTDSSYKNSHAQIGFIVGPDKQMGLSYINAQSFTSKIKLEAGATHVAYRYRVEPNVTVYFNPLGVGEKTLITDNAYHYDTISLATVTVADSIAAPFAVRMTTTKTAGSVATCYITDLKIIKK